MESTSFFFLLMTFELNIVPFFDKFEINICRYYAAFSYLLLKTYIYESSMILSVRQTVHVIFYKKEKRVMQEILVNTYNM